MPNYRRKKRKNNKRTRVEANLSDSDAPPRKRLKVDEQPSTQEENDEPQTQDLEDNNDEDDTNTEVTPIEASEDEQKDESIFTGFSEIASEFDSEHEKIVEIDDIGPFLRESCSLTFLVIHVSKRSAKTNYEKNILELVVTDSTNKKIKILCWEEKAIEFGQIKEKTHYKITNFRVRRNAATFQIFHQYYLMAVPKTKIEPLSESEVEQAKLPVEVTWKFTKLKDLVEAASSAQDRFDVFGIILEISEVESKVGSFGKTSRNREIKIMDETGFCTVTLWNHQCDYEFQKFEIVAFIGGRKSDWNQVSLTNIGFVKQISDNKEIEGLKKWLIKTKPIGLKKHLEELESKRILSGLMTFSELRDVKEDVFYSDDAGNSRYCLVLGTICEIDPYRLFYQNAKTGTKYKINITIKNRIGDKLKLIAFDDIGRQLFGVAATQVQTIQEQDSKIFATKMEELMAKQTPKIFRIQLRKNEYFGTENVQLILNQMKMANKIMAKKTKIFSKNQTIKNVTASDTSGTKNEEDDLK